jgi:hypothetical protein
MLKATGKDVRLLLGGSLFRPCLFLVNNIVVLRVVKGLGREITFENIHIPALEP